MSELLVELNFKFKDAKLQNSLQTLFGNIRRNKIALPEGLRTELLELFPSHETEVVKVLARNHLCDDLLEYIEEVKKYRGGLSVSCFGEGDHQTSVPLFMQFIRSVGGTALACSVQNDYFCTSYKMDKNGNIIDTTRNNED